MGRTQIKVRGLGRWKRVNSKELKPKKRGSRLYFERDVLLVFIKGRGRCGKDTEESKRFRTKKNHLSRVED